MTVERVTVWKRKGRFAGWPANNGIWCWGDEILVGFDVGFMQLGGGFHLIDRNKDILPWFARSMDGGQTWCDEPGIGVSLPRDKDYFRKINDADIELNSYDFCMTGRMANIHVGPSYLFTSPDRGQEWFGPYIFPFHCAARTDYVVRDSVAYWGLTIPKINQKEGHPYGVTIENGRSVDFTGRMWGDVDARSFAIMPSIAFGENEKELVSAIRMKRRRLHSIELSASEDNGLNWKRRSSIELDSGKGGNPASLIRLDDQRLFVSYGIRREPYPIVYRVSSNNGRSWSKPVGLRFSSGGHDMGYTRSVQRTDGSVVTVYYVHDHPNTERYIEAAICKP